MLPMIYLKRSAIITADPKAGCARRPRGRRAERPPANQAVGRVAVDLNVRKADRAGAFGDQEGSLFDAFRCLVPIIGA